MKCNKTQHECGRHNPKGASQYALFFQTSKANGHKNGNQIQFLILLQRLLRNLRYLETLILQIMRFRLGQTKGWQCNGHEEEGHARHQQSIQIFILLLLVATVVKYEDGNTREEVRKQRKMLHRLSGC